MIPSPEQLRFIEQIITEFMQEQKIPGLSIAVVNHENVLFSSSYGSRNLALQLHANPSTLFGIGSITKSFICLALLLLEQQGLLSLDDPVSKHIDFFLDKNSDQKILLRHLMSHSSGIPNLGTIEATIGRKVFDIETFTPIASKKDVLHFINFAKDEIFFNPGERFYYSNESYFLLGLIIEKVSGLVDFEDFIINSIFKPLAMNRTTFSQEIVEQDPDYSLGYKVTPDGIKDKPLYYGYTAKAAGGVVSSVSDMANYMQFLLNKGTFNGKTILERKYFGWVGIF